MQPANDSPTTRGRCVTGSPGASEVNTTQSRQSMQRHPQRQQPRQHPQEQQTVQPQNYRQQQQQQQQQQRHQEQNSHQQYSQNLMASLQQAGLPIILATAPFGENSYQTSFLNSGIGSLPMAYFIPGSSQGNNVSSDTLRNNPKSAFTDLANTLPIQVLGSGLIPGLDNGSAFIPCLENATVLRADQLSGLGLAGLGLAGLGLDGINLNDLTNALVLDPVQISNLQRAGIDTMGSIQNLNQFLTKTGEIRNRSQFIDLRDLPPGTEQTRLQRQHVQDPFQQYLSNAYGQGVSQSATNRAGLKDSASSEIPTGSLGTNDKKSDDVIDLTEKDDNEDDEREVVEIESDMPRNAKGKDEQKQVIESYEIDSSDPDVQNRNRTDVANLETDNENNADHPSMKFFGSGKIASENIKKNRAKSFSTVPTRLLNLSLERPQKHVRSLEPKATSIKPSSYRNKNSESSGAVGDALGVQDNPRGSFSHQMHVQTIADMFLGKTKPSPRANTMDSFSLSPAILDDVSSIIRTAFHNIVPDTKPDPIGCRGRESAPIDSAEFGPSSVEEAAPQSNDIAHLEVIMTQQLKRMCENKRVIQKLRKQLDNTYPALNKKQSEDLKVLRQQLASLNQKSCSSSTNINKTENVNPDVIVPVGENGVACPRESYKQKTLVRAMEQVIEKLKMELTSERKRGSQGLQSYVKASNSALEVLQTNGNINSACSSSVTNHQHRFPGSNRSKATATSKSTNDTAASNTTAPSAVFPTIKKRKRCNASKVELTTGRNCSESTSKKNPVKVKRKTMTEADQRHM